MADPLGMPRGVDERDRRALRHPEQREAVDARGVDDGLEVGDPGLHGELAELAVGEPAPSLVVADERVAVAQLGQPVTPDRALPVEVEMRQPRRRPHDRRPAAVDGVRQPHAVASGAEANLLRHAVDLTPVDEALLRGDGDFGSEPSSGVATHVPLTRLARPAASSLRNVSRSSGSAMSKSSSRCLTERPSGMSASHM